MIALAPQDIDESSKLDTASVTIAELKESESENPRGRSRVREDLNMSGSYSRVKLRDMTPLGTRNYAAPEMLSGIRKVQQSISDSFHRRRTRRASASECISDYGMVADAYSIGTTISHLVTGIPPNINADEFLASKNHPLKKFARKMKGRFSDKKTTRAKKYKLRSDLPLDVNEVIRLLTHFDARRRCTVRYARSLLWIKGDDDDDDDADKGNGSAMDQSFMKTGGPILHLHCSEND